MNYERERERDKNNSNKKAALVKLFSGNNKLPDLLPPQQYTHTQSYSIY